MSGGTFSWPGLPVAEGELSLNWTARRERRIWPWEELKIKLWRHRELGEERDKKIYREREWETEVHTEREREKERQTERGRDKEERSREKRQLIYEGREYLSIKIVIIYRNLQYTENFLKVLPNKKSNLTLSFFPKNFTSMSWPDTKPAASGEAIWR